MKSFYLSIYAYLIWQANHFRHRFDFDADLMGSSKNSKNTTENAKVIDSNNSFYKSGRSNFCYLKFQT